MSIVLVWLFLISVIVIVVLLSGKNSKNKIEVIKNFFSFATSSQTNSSNIQKKGEKAVCVFVSIEKYDQLRLRVENLERDIAKIYSLYEKLSLESKNTETYIKQLSNTTERQINIVKHEFMNLRSNIESGTKEEHEEHESKCFPQTVYATHMDSVIPKGFTHTSLTASAGAYLYKITIENPFEASFELTDNLAVQQELLLTLQSGILNDTCDFDGTPVETSNQINTIENGRLLKENGVWIILKKIIVKFS